MPTFTKGQAVADPRTPARTGTITAVDGGRITITWADGREQNYATATAHGRLFVLVDASGPKRRTPKKSSKTSGSSRTPAMKKKSGKRKRS